MSSYTPSEGTFFVGQQPAAAAPAPDAAPAPLVTPIEPAAPAPPPAQAAEPPSGNAMRDVPLGTLIFRAGLLAEEQLEDALQEGMRTGKRLGEVLSQRGLIRDADLGRLLAGQQGLPYVDIATIPVDPAARLLPESIARIQNALAFALEDGVPVVAVADPTNELVVENVRRALGTEPRLVVAAHGELARKIDEAYSAVAAQAAATVAAPVAEPPAPVAAPTPVAEPPAPVVAEPVQVEQPAPAPAAPAPMPTVVPPPEERAPEAPAEPVVAVAPTEAAPSEVPPLHVEAAAAPPLAPEPSVAPPQVAPPTEQVAPPAEQVAAAPVAPSEPVLPAEPAAPTAAEPPGLFVQAAEQALAPPVEEPPVEVTLEPAPVEAAASETAAANGAPDVTPTHFVVLRLTGEDRVEIGGFASQDEAESFARTVVGRITRAEEQADWPFFADRFLRPQTIVSVDVVAHETNKWMGSTLRSQWANPSGA